jgi:hypothetical protein
MAAKKRKRRAKAAKPAKRKAGKRKAAKRKAAKRVKHAAKNAGDATAGGQWPGAAAPKKRKRRSTAAKASVRVRRKRRKVGRGRLEIALAVPTDIAIDGAELEGITTAQRLELAALGNKHKTGAVPSFVADPDVWAKAVRSIRSHWGRYTYPYAAALWVYHRFGGTLSSHAAAAHKAAVHRLATRRPAAQA